MLGRTIKQPDRVEHQVDLLSRFNSHSICMQGLQGGYESNWPTAYKPRPFKTLVQAFRRIDWN